MTALSRLATGAAAIALTCDGRSWTYAALRAETDRLTGALRADRLAGERVALMLPNGPELVTCYLACFAAGAVAAPLNARYAAPEVAQALLRARPRWLIVHADRLGTVAAVDTGALRGVRVVVVGDAPPGAERYSAVLRAGGPAADGAGIEADSAAVIFFTSGSTGRPKGVVHSHASAYAMLTSTAEALGGVTAADRLQVFEPLVHVSGFIVTFTALLAGAQVALHDGFDPDDYARALRTDRPTLICTHVDVLAQLLRVPGVNREWFSSLRGVYTGGDTVPAAVQRAFGELSGLPIGVGYGMTEAIWLTVQRRARPDGEGCIGRPVGGARLRTDAATGELLVAGPMVMQRYFDDQPLTAATLVDGWLHTGDLARQDADGRWWFTGRIKDVIVRRTSKITPGEVEAALQQHPRVAAAAVVAAADPEEGQVPIAFVVAGGKPAPTPAELTAFLGRRIAAYKVPVRVHLLESLPLTASGKVSRKDLREPTD